MVKKTIIKCENVMKNVEDSQQAVLYLTDEKEKVLGCKNVQFVINGVTYDKTTDADGKATININLGMGDYNKCKAKFNGDSDYSASEVEFDIKVTGKPTKIEASDISLVQGSGGKFTARLADGKGVALANMETKMTINGVTYNKVTDPNGYFSLTINLGVGQYPIKCEFDGGYNYVKSSVEKTVTVTGKDSVISILNTEITKGTQNQVKLTDKSNNPIGGQDIYFFVNKPEPYIKQTDANGVAGLTINLNAGTYPITYHYVGNNQYKRFDIAGEINVKNPAPTPAPVTCNMSGNWYINKNFFENSSNLAQTTNTDCGPQALKACIYNLTGKIIPNSLLIGWCGTGSAGTAHSGLEAGLKKAGDYLGVKFAIEWHYLSDIGWERIAQACCRDGESVFIHVLYKYLYGHYENIWGVNLSTSTVGISNSLSNGSYRGWREYRSFALCKGYMNGISQKSVAIVKLV